MTPCERQNQLEIIIINIITLNSYGQGDWVNSLARYLRSEQPKFIQRSSVTHKIGKIYHSQRETLCQMYDRRNILSDLTPG